MTKRATRIAGICNSQLDDSTTSVTLYQPHSIHGYKYTIGFHRFAM